ncbi:MAG: FHA domain-containing protein [Rhodothermales bacterium]
MNADVLPDGTLKLDAPVQLPEVLDMLIVGGGPAGTAAAFRAKELGLSALVVDYDDLMKRIRDYAKDKLILPHFGGGDQMRFPAGGPLISSLHFEAIDKDDICLTWRALYRKHNVPAKIGIELTGITRKEKDLLEVKTWNHRSQCEELVLARHVVLSIGRGVPRRFDIPGNTDGISYRLDDAADYVGGPVCVVGGGTSAAEAVIAISDAKMAANDECPVYWSYRGDKMPKVSKALSEVFFNAYLGNGNIRYYPKSEPVAIVSGPERAEYLSIRVDRRTIEGRSIETTHLEFLKKNCIACIGEDIPEQFLNSLGIHMATGGPKNKKQMVVSPLLETQQRNVYLVGDILSQRYLEADRFDADPATFREIRHPGNIKSALRDGVFVAQVIQQKLEGRQEIDVVLADADVVEAKAVESESVASSASFIREKVTGSTGDFEAKLAPQGSAKLIRITQTGLEEDEYVLSKDKETTIGRQGTDIIFPGEASLGDKHATVLFKEGVFQLKDAGSTTGSFYRLPPGELIEVSNGDLIHLGRQFLVFSLKEGTWGCLQYDHQGTLKQRYRLSKGTIVMGRDAPDITLDAEDSVLSRRHLAVSVKEGKLFLKDLMSLNHVYLRVKALYPLKHDDVIRLGQYLFKLSLGTEAIKSNHVSVVLPAPTPSPVQETPAQEEQKASPPSVPASASTGPSITFVGHGSAIPVTPDDNVLSIARDNNVPIHYECESGRCGYDPVKIISGQEHLNEMDEDEEGWTLEEVCHLEPGTHRLACLLKTKGPIVVEVIKK